MSKYRLGQIVHLRSNGPNMVVASIKTEPYEIYHCTWFDSNGKYSSCEFDTHELTDGNEIIGFKKGAKSEGCMTMLTQK